MNSFACNRSVTGYASTELRPRRPERQQLLLQRGDPSTQLLPLHSASVVSSFRRNFATAMTARQHLLSDGIGRRHVVHKTRETPTRHGALGCAFGRNFEVHSDSVHSVPRALAMQSECCSVFDVGRALEHCLQTPFTFEQEQGSKACFLIWPASRGS